MPAKPLPFRPGACSRAVKRVAGLSEEVTAVSAAPGLSHVCASRIWRPEAGTKAIVPHTLVLAAIVALGAAVRLFHLTALSLYLDEAASATAARLSWPALLHLIASAEPWMALYYVFLHGWVHLGDSDSMLRFPSVVFAVATIPVIYALGEHLFDRATGLLAAVLFALHSQNIEYSQQARSYTLLVMLSAMSSLFFLKAMTEPRFRTWCGYVVSTVLAVYSFLLGGLLIIAHFAALPFMRRERKVKYFVISSAVIGVFLLPLAAVSVSVALAPGGHDWIKPLSLRRVFILFESFTGRVYGVGGVAIVCAYTVAIGIALSEFVKALRAHRPEVESYAFLLAGVLGPVVPILAISFFKPMLVDRYLFVCVPPFVLLAAAGARRLGEAPVLLYALAICFVAGFLVQAHTLLTYFGIEDWPDSVAYVMSEARPGDGLVLFPPESRVAFDYYQGRSGLSPASVQIVYPKWDSNFRVDGIYVFNGNVPKPDARLTGKLPSTHPRLWVVFRASDEREWVAREFKSLRSSLGKEYTLAQDRRFLGIEVLLFEAKRTTQSTSPSH